MGTRKRFSFICSRFVLPCLITLAVLSPALHASSFVTKDEALARAFPGAGITKHTVFLKEEDLGAVEKKSGVKPSSRLFSYHMAHGKEGIAGYAVMESHIIRTKQAAYIAVINPDGTLRHIEMLSFNEPPEYMPSKRWLSQFTGKRLGERLWINRDIQAISGATLTSYGITREVRKSLAIMEMFVLKEVKGG